MAQVPHGDIRALKSDGTIVEVEKGASGSIGCKLLAASTYYFAIGAADCPTEAISIRWDATFVGSFTFETTDFNLLTISDIDVSKGGWIQQNPTTAYISVTSTDGTTGGATVTNMTIAVLGGSAGGASVQLGNLGSRRTRTKAAVTTGGSVLVASSGKS